MSKIKVAMTFSKSTKSTHVYSAESEVIPTLYIKKEGLPEEPPKKLTVEISFTK